jgi:hypothetical protein
MLLEPGDHPLSSLLSEWRCGDSAKRGEGISLAVSVSDCSTVKKSGEKDAGRGSALEAKRKAAANPTCRGLPPTEAQHRFAR